MVETRTEFPQLRTHRRDLEHSLHQAISQADEARILGKSIVPGAEAWIERTQAELTEIDYIERHFEDIRRRQDLGWRHWQTILLTIVALASLALSFLAYTR